MTVRGAVMAGGGATRMGGRPKGLERVGGERILDRLVAEFEAALGEPPALIANDPAAPAWRPGLRVIADLVPGAGALGGIYTAVAAVPAPVVVVAWDMPFVTAGLIRALADGLGGADACLPESDGRRGVEPLCAAYGPACAGPIRDALAAGDRRAIAFHAAVRVRTLPPAAIRAFGAPDVLFFNVNTDDDLTKADALWRDLESIPSSGTRTPARPR